MEGGLTKGFYKSRRYEMPATAHIFEMEKVVTPT